jgi:Domain of unknown function (DUF4136)
VKLAVWALAVLVASAQLPPKEGKIESVKDAKANFASFTTYKWEPGYEAYDKSVHRLLVDAIDGELVARGFKKLDGNAASVTIRYHTVVRTDVSLDTLDEYERAGKIAPARQLGRLVIVMRTPDNKRVWAADTVQPIPDASTREADLRQIVARLFETYPLPKK